MIVPSPQGGENKISHDKTAFLVSTIPVRGRKPELCFVIGQGSGTIPVRGRKQIHNALVCDIVRTIPVRGRKRIAEITIDIANQYHPRKGTETSLPCHQSLCTRFQLLPAKPSQALRASSPERGSFCSCRYPVLSSPFGGAGTA